MGHFKNLTSKLRHRLLLVIPCLLGLLATANASDILQLSYTYEYGIAKDAGENAFVICDDCPERKILPLRFRQKILSSLAVRASNNVTEEPAFANQHIQRIEKEEVRK